MTENNETTTTTPDGWWAHVNTLLRTRITAGLVLILPIWITVLVVGFMFRTMRNASLWLVEALVLSPVGEPLLRVWNVSPDRVAEDGNARHCSLWRVTT